MDTVPSRSNLSNNLPRDKSDETPTESSEQPSPEMDQMVKALFEEEELLLGEHMQVRVSESEFATKLVADFLYFFAHLIPQAIHENAELLTEEGQILSEAQGDNPDMEEYAHRLDNILEKKIKLITSLRSRLLALSKKEEELASSSGRSKHE